MPVGRPTRALVLCARLLATCAGLVAACSDELERFATATSDEPGPGARIPDSFDALSPVSPPDAGRVSPEQPSVRCVTPAVRKDSGSDAEALDGSSDASDPSDAGDAGDASDAGGPCDVPPPPACATPTVMVTYQRGTCVAGSCDFRPATRGCPGGCFRGIDGGYGCQP